MRSLTGEEVKNSVPKTIKWQLLNKYHLINISLFMLFAVILSAFTLKDREFSVENVAGTFLVVALLLFLLYKDFIRYKPLIYRNYKIMMLVGVLLSGNFIIGRGFYYILGGFSIWLGNIDHQLTIYAIPLATGAMLAALLIDIHTAIVFSVITSLLAGIWIGSPFYSVFTFPSGLTAAFGVIRCKKRSAIWRAGFFVSLVC